MMSEEEHLRYDRHLRLPGFGEEAQQKLKDAKVLVIGAGGLGSPALIYLAAAGVGTLGIIDDDDVDISNLQRQILFHTEETGQPKAGLAGKRVQSLNPHVQVNVLSKRLTRDNALEVLEGYDVIVDGSDNFATRYLVNDACVILGKPLVYGSIFKFEGQVSVFNYQNGPTYRCLFPEAPAPGEMPSCSEIGVLGVLPGVVGTYQANETIKIITGIGEPLSGRLLIMDLLNSTFNSFEIQANEANKSITQLATYGENCDIPGGSEVISPTTFEHWKSTRPDVMLVDVREPYEYARQNIGGENIPLRSLRAHLAELPTVRPVVFTCQSGQRSLQALQLFKEAYPEAEAYSLEGGIVKFNKEKASTT